MTNFAQKTALIFGVTGQDGSYLAELLLDQGYQEVMGVARRTSTPNTQRLAGIIDHPRFRLVEGDITDAACVIKLIHQFLPDEVYNLAAQSHVGTSFQQPSLTASVVYGGCLNVLEAVRLLHPDSRPRVYQASSSEMFGSQVSLMYTELGQRHYDAGQLAKDPLAMECSFQNESTPMLPNSPYAIAKLAAHNLCRVYRESYDMHISCGILFNHESSRRGENFVTRKITKHVARLHLGLTKKPLKLGNLDAYRDWGFAPDFVSGMMLMLQQEKGGDYVLATGKAHSVLEFVETAFAVVKRQPKYVVDVELLRPCEVPYLKGDYSKAKRELDWEPKTSFEEMVMLMVGADLKRELACGV